eukprot:gene15152-20410_t
MSASLSPVNPVNALQFFDILGKLKTLKRSGWINHGINLPESVADHMYRMSMLSFIITDSTINKDKLMKICLVHDLAEAVVGDITPYDGITKEEKRILEENALRKILIDLDCSKISEEMLSLWLDYEEGYSPEAEIAKQLDKLEMIIQANEYEIVQPEKRLDSFFDSTKDSFLHPEILSWANELRQQRSQRINSNI